MIRRTGLLASGLLLLVTAGAASQEPMSVQEAISQVVKIGGKLKLDGKVVVEVDV